MSATTTARCVATVGLDSLPMLPFGLCLLLLREYLLSVPGRDFFRVTSSQIDNASQKPKVAEHCAMTLSQAKELLLIHAGYPNHPKTERGFLGSLRPFQGQLVEENFHEVMSALRVLEPV